ncbi:MAG: ester cyclase [Gaiellaceae bacterium]
MGAQAHKETIARAIELWNAHDDGYFDVYAEDAGIHGFPGDAPPTVEGMKGLFHGMWASFPDMRVEPVRLIVEGDLGAGTFRIGGTHEREFLGAAPSGNRIEIEAMSFFRFGPDGKIVERWTRLDEVGLLGQLGLMPVPEAAPA